DWNIVDLNHNISSGDRDIYVLGLRNNTGTLTIADPNENLDETNSGQALNVTHYLEIDGVIDLVGESQLVQTAGSILDTDSGGYIERDQQGTANGFNYNYWSSSVGPISGNTTTRGTGISSSNTVHTISGVLLDGTNSAVYQNLIFSPYQDAANSSSTTPRTVSTYWMYKFYGEVDNYNAWESIDETSSLLPGEGYTMKGTSGAADILNDFQNYVFKGKPNNGDITLTLDKSTGDVQRLIGNPYPSAIDATEFILDNMSIADGGNNETGTIFNGALYFWDHFGEENSHNLSDYVGGYATRNLTGGVAAISDDNLINNTSNNGGPAIGTKVPGPYIPVNQGFLVSTALDGFNNDQGVPISNVDGGNIVFKNSQRVFARESTENSVFMRSVEDNSSNTYFDDTKRIRLMYDSPKGYHRQILLGKNQNTTNGFDLGYDAFIADINEEDMYWIFDSGKFVIQSVNNFDIIQEFPIGIIINESGLARIKVDTLENIDSSLTIHIRDNYTNQTHHINEDPFEIYLETGTYDDRFELVFQEQTMSVSDKTKLEKEITVYYDSNFAEVRINNKNNIQIFGISLYNTLGQRILELDHLSNNISLSNVNLGVYILYLNTEKGPLSKKILIN
ncbi:MAG: T9SS type A sorting domain-containing protein, partial [Bacteroidia bacterium]|nr:T9SS type A sorting domain-containing protein [Bacteroidia bacterium]